MAFRRLTFAEKFAFRGATSWRPTLVNPSSLGNPAKCPWGFVPQTQLAKAMTQHKDRYRFHVHVDPAGKFTQGKSVAEDFARHSIDFAEFKEGAAYIYDDASSLFCDPTVDFRDVELVSPRLSLFLNDCLTAYEAAGYGTPSIEIATGGIAADEPAGAGAGAGEAGQADEQAVSGDAVKAIEALPQDIQKEFGNIDHYGKYFGLYDGQEVRFHMLGGFSPEITTANEFMGDGPQRIVASVLYSVREKVWFPEKEDKPVDFSTNIHYFDFESSLRGPINWRLRNINKSIDTP